MNEMSCGRGLAYLVVGGRGCPKKKFSLRGISNSDGMSAMSGDKRKEDLFWSRVFAEEEMRYSLT